jgi:hypothetical protein
MAGQIEQTHVPRRRLLYCPKCGGDGMIYRNPQKIVGLLTSVRQDKQHYESGWAQPGDAILSTHPGHDIIAGDLITFTWDELLADGQVVVRGAGTASDNSARGIGLNADEDRLHYPAVSAIWCEDEDGRVYRSGADFVLDGSRVIRWVGQTPQRGQAYTIKYSAYLEWIAFTQPNTRRDRDRDLGARVLLRKRHVAMMNDDPKARMGDRIPFCSRISGC